jgi:hypothetical protein
VIGYTITFGQHAPITIYHGQDGKDGADGKDGQDGQNGSANAPVIGVAQDTDGLYYWTLNGEWLLDDNGNKLPVSGKDGQNGTNGSNGQDGADGKDGQNGEDGKDGITPQLKIEDGYWYISYDNGVTWTQLGKATGEDGKDGVDGEDGKDGQNGTDGKDGQDGDSMFQSVTQDENYVYFTLADGTVIKIAKGSGSNNQPNEEEFIIFRDLVVKSALLKLGIDTDRNNEISYGEAKAYIGEISMKNNTNIYSFNEFQYFTNVTSCNFSGCTNLFEIVLPSCLTSIAESSFSNCSSITSIVIPNSVQSIEESAFSECTSLKSITIPNSVTNIGRDAFYKCPLESFTFSENYNGDTFVFGLCDASICPPTTIYWNAIDYKKDFYEKYYIYDRYNAYYGLGGARYYSLSSTLNTPTNLKNVIFGSKVQTIPNYICAYLQEITEINIPNSVTTIGEYAFYNCTSVNSVTFGNSVNSIGAYAFSGCESITAIEIPNSVKVINQYAFYNSTGLTSITLGNAITDIGYCAFHNCTKLQKLYCRASNPPLLGTTAIPTTIGIIYVPRTSVDEYKALWSEYANKIVGYDFE